MSVSSHRFDELCAKKAFEIAYATLRLGSVMRSRSFAESFERQGVLLLEAAGAGDHDRIRHLLTTLEYFLRLGREADFISREHGEVLFGEIAAFRSVVADFDHTARATQPGLGDIFTRLDWNSPEAPNTELPRVFPKPNAAKEATIYKNAASDNSADMPATPTPPRTEDERMRIEERQRTVLDRIRQTGNCRLKDIQEVLPGTSERTIRYDIQELIARGRIERVGGGGPATYYRAKMAGAGTVLLPPGLAMPGGSQEA